MQGRQHPLEKGIQVINRFMKASSTLLMMALITTTGVANAQSEDRTSPPTTRRAHDAQAVNAEVGGLLSAGSYSAYCIYNYSGSHVLATCWDSRINSNSRVFASLSEYDYRGAYGGRFMGSARMTVHNVVPFNGGVTVWTDVEWGSPLNVRMDLLVDP
jgi:hypothetical protein